MDILFEVIGELISGIFELLVETERIPKAVRIFVTLLLFLPMTVLSILAALLLSEKVIVRVIFILLALLFIAGAAKFIIKIIRRN